MECMEAKALKNSSFSTELQMKATNPQSMDDIWCVTGMGTEDFSVDEFFDLPNEDFHDSDNGDVVGGFFEEEEEELEDEEKCSNSSFSPSLHDDFPTNSASFSTHLAIPDDDMQELELWSHLMDDSVPHPTLVCPKPVTDAYSKKSEFTIVNRIEPGSKRTMAIASFFTLAVPVKPRTKRSRTTGNQTWLMGSPPKSEELSSSSLFSLPSPVSTLLFAPPVHGMGMYFTYGKPPVKKPKKKPASSLNVETGSNSPVQRRCSHCQVTKTPQWRAGPNGPKTLCNACGVRFKSGRLFPEYRPACSPTFSSEVHSNSHRKVIEMRRKKEMGETELVADSTLAISSS